MAERGHLQEIDRIFATALELPDSEQAAYLDSACAGRPEVRRAVDDLLHQESSPDPLFDLDAGFQRRWLGEAESTLFTGQDRRVGPWRLGSEIGRGGMGVVYLAERVDGEFEQRAALKILRLESDPARQLRFLQERQILANLEHPGFARLLDGGVTGDRLPYLAMEYVDGQPIHEFCEERDLPIRERLALFLEVCSAVEAAHGQLVVHRDLKPSNILVAREGRVKLLDFGIAKRLAEEESSGIPVTADQMRLMTPAYASPEQYRGEKLGVASDVYQLGILLHQLLTDQLPYDLKSLTPGGAERVICERIPPLASTRGHDASRRRTLRGDLDTIVAKALRKSPEERYPTVHLLALDVRRHLDGLPVLARRPTLSYHVSKFIGRHRLGTAAVFGMLILALFLTVTYTAGLRSERERAEEAQAVAEEAYKTSQELSRFLVDLFDIADPERADFGPVDALALLENASAELTGGLEAQPLARARFQQAIGEIYTKLARYDQAEELVVAALATRRKELPTEHPEILASANQLGMILGRQGRFEDAEALFREVHQVREAEGDLDLLAESLNNLGNLALRRDDLPKAADLHRQALEIRQRVLPAGHQHLADSANNLGSVLTRLGRHGDAEVLLEEALAIFERTLRHNHPRRAVALNNLGLVEMGLGQWADAEQHFREAAELWREAYGAEHPHVVRAQQNVANLLHRQAKYEQSIELLEEILALQEAKALAEPLEIARTLALLGAALGEAGRHDDGDVALRQSLAIRQQRYGLDHLLSVSVRERQARILFLRGQAAEAEWMYRELLPRRLEIYGAESANFGRTQFGLARTLVRQKRYEEARKFLRQALELLDGDLPDGHPETEEIRRELEDLERFHGFG